MGNQKINTAATKVVTGRVRGSYVSVFTPRAVLDDGGNPRLDSSGKPVMEYSMVVLLPKSDKATYAKLEAAAEAAMETKTWDRGIKPKDMMECIHDGDGERPNGGSYGPEAAGHWVFNVKSKYQPGIIDRNRQEVIEPRDFQSGDYCKVALNAYGYTVKGRRGISFGLNNVMVLEKGEPLGGASRAEDEDWDEEEDF